MRGGLSSSDCGGSVFVLELRGFFLHRISDPVLPYFVMCICGGMAVELGAAAGIPAIYA